MKKIAVIVFCFLAFKGVAQDNATANISIIAKPVDPKAAFSFFIAKKAREITIVYQSVDSIGKIQYEENDLATIQRLISKSEKFFDSLSNDSLAFFQRKLDSISQKNTHFKMDSTTIYKNTHPAYWKLVSVILDTSNEMLEKRNSVTNGNQATFCFFSLKQNGGERKVYIDAIDEKKYPLLAKLVNSSLAAISAHREVMKRRNK